MRVCLPPIATPNQPAKKKMADRLTQLQDCLDQVFFRPPTPKLKNPATHRPQPPARHSILRFHPLPLHPPPLLRPPPLSSHRQPVPTRRYRRRTGFQRRRGRRLFPGRAERAGARPADEDAPDCIPDLGAAGGGDEREEPGGADRGAGEGGKGGGGGEGEGGEGDGGVAGEVGEGDWGCEAVGNGGGGRGKGEVKGGGREIYECARL